MNSDNSLVKNINNVSTVCTLLILFLHSYNYNLSIKISSITPSFIIQGFISNGLARVSVPLFFIISGFLFFYKKKVSIYFFKNQLKKRLFTLVVPLLLWSTIGFLLFFIIQLTPFLNTFYNNFNVSNFSFLDILKKIFIYPVPYQLWFLQVLVICSVLSPILWFILNKKHSIFFLFGLFTLWILYGGYNGFEEYFFEGIFFFSLGIFIVQKHKVSLHFNTLFYTFIAVIFISIKTYLSVFYSYKISYFFGKIVILLCIPLVWKISESTNIKNNLFSLINKYKFWIFLSHEPLLTINKKLMFTLSNTNDLFHLLVYFSAPIITLFQCLIFAKLTSNKFPTLYNLLVGGRSSDKKHLHA